MQTQKKNRRVFLKNAALAGLAASVPVAVTAPDASAQASPAEMTPAQSTELHGYGERSRFETAARTGTMGDMYPPGGLAPGAKRDFGLRAPLQDTVGFITPASLHYVISHAHEPPDIDPREHRLMIHGMVERPLIFTMEELKRLPSVSRAHFVECNADSAPAGPGGAARVSPNATVQDTHGFTSCSLWTGVPLSLLLNQAGVKKGATWIVAEGAEESKHAKSIPVEKAIDDVLVAYGQNGEAIRPQQGYPLRLLVPGWEGINNVKWLRRIKLVDEPYMGMMEATKYPSLRLDGKARWFQFELGPRSVITRPSGGQKLAGPGFYEITGLAWSGRGTIRRVEVSVDAGRTWKDAQIQGPAYAKAHTRFGFPWTWNGEEAILQTRCSDDQGEVQPTMAELAKTWNVDVDFFRNTSIVVGHFNAIQPWKINRDGSVQNALFA
jgi:sulfane dehydrogenase subunit SoxC